MRKSRSVVKRARQNEARRKRNASVKTRVRHVRKAVLTLLSQQELSQAKEALKESVPVIAKAAAKGVIPKKRAARYISRLTKKVNALGPSP